MTTNPSATPTTGWKGDTTRGASYGRRSTRIDANELPTRSVYLSRVKIDSGGYDEGGAYWGVGQPLYCAYSDGYDEYCEYVWAASRSDAAHQLGLTSEQLRKPLAGKQ